MAIEWQLSGRRVAIVWQVEMSISLHMFSLAEAGGRQKTEASSASILTHPHEAVKHIEDAS